MLGSRQCSPSAKVFLSSSFDLANLRVLSFMNEGIATPVERLHARAHLVARRFSSSVDALTMRSIARPMRYLA